LLIQYASRLESESASARKRIAALEKDNADLKRRVDDGASLIVHRDWLEIVDGRPHKWINEFVPGRKLLGEKIDNFWLFVIRDAQGGEYIGNVCLTHGETRVLHSPEKKP
jgi:hypothetical protein